MDVPADLSELPLLAVDSMKNWGHRGHLRVLPSLYVDILCV